MLQLSFNVNSESEAFCLAIVSAMRSRFGITHTEAIMRLNQQWRGLDLTGPNDMIYHEDENYWASTIYYGANSDWWLSEEERRNQGLPALTPVKLSE
jgi:sugar lactone lactonase YvrE